MDTRLAENIGSRMGLLTSTAKLCYDKAATKLYVCSVCIMWVCLMSLLDILSPYCNNMTEKTILFTAHTSTSKCYCCKLLMYVSQHKLPACSCLAASSVWPHYTNTRLLEELSRNRPTKELLVLLIQILLMQSRTVHRHGGF